MLELIAEFVDLSGLFKDPVHRAERAQVGAFIQQRGIDFGRRLVAEALCIEVVEDKLPFSRSQSLVSCKMSLEPEFVSHTR